MNNYRLYGNNSGRMMQNQNRNYGRMDGRQGMDCGCGKQEMKRAMDCGCNKQDVKKETDCGCKKQEVMQATDCECKKQDEKREKDCGCSVESMYHEMKQNGSCMECEEDMPGKALAMAYVPWQTWRKLYEICEGFKTGTIFKELDLEFMGRRCN